MRNANDGESPDDKVETFGEEVLLSSEVPSVYLDSCASIRLFIVKDTMAPESFTSEFGAIQLTRKGSQLEIQGTGTFKEWKDISVGEEATNIVSGECCDQRATNYNCSENLKLWIWTPEMRY